MPCSIYSSYSSFSVTNYQIISGPGFYDPEIGSGFPLIFPDSPLVGDDIRIECWASGTSTPPMVYFWDRIEKIDENTERIIPLPLQSYMDDHNRCAEFNLTNILLSLIFLSTISSEAFAFILSFFCLRTFKNCGRA